MSHSVPGRVPLLANQWLAGACLLMYALTSGSGAEPSAKAEYAGGTIGWVPANRSGSIRVTRPDVFEFTAGKARLEVPYERIHMLEYGQKVSRRYAIAVLISPMFLLSKSRRHYLTIGYTDAEGHRQAMVFRVDKKHIRPVLVGLEARTGLKVQYQDGEARKAGKG